MAIKCSYGWVCTANFLFIKCFKPLEVLQGLFLAWNSEKFVKYSL